MRPAKSTDQIQALRTALDVAARRRVELADLRSHGRPGAGIEALCNGALRTVIRLSLDRRRARGEAKGLSPRQLDKVMRLLSLRRVFETSP